MLLGIFDADRGEVVAEIALQYIGRALAIVVGRRIGKRDALLVAESEPGLGVGKGLQIEWPEFGDALRLVDLRLEALDLLHGALELVIGAIESQSYALVSIGGFESLEHSSSAMAESVSSGSRRTRPRESAKISGSLKDR